MLMLPPRNRIAETLQRTMWIEAAMPGCCHTQPPDDVHNFC
jgi:hypothetical protein